MREKDYHIFITLGYKDYVGAIILNIQSDYRKIHAISGAVSLMNHGYYKPDMTIAENRMHIDVDSSGYATKYALFNRDGDILEFEFDDVGGYVTGVGLVEEGGI